MRKWFGWLPKSKWKRNLALVAIAGFGLFCLVVGLGVSAYFLWRVPGVQGWVMARMLKHEARQPLETPKEPSLGAEAALRLETNATTLKAASELFRTTNIWAVQLRFTERQWTALGPNEVSPISSFIRPDGTLILRNPKASRAGIAGVFGFDMPWSQGDVEFAGIAFTNVGARFKGNGTFLGALRSYKRPLKIELSKHMPSQKLAGRAILNFHNLSADFSYLSDTLAYEFFRDAGVPAPRTAFARLLLTVEGRFERRLLGLHVFVENPDADWAREQFGVDGVALFKPVTFDLFKDLGDDWQAYQDIYDPKTETTERHHRRVIGLARLVTKAGEAEFAARIADFIDLEEFARFLAGQVIVSNYDSILDNGQNFLFYLDPRTDRFGFIPWDLDHSWGEFPFLGTADQREQASIWRPWVGKNRFLERMLAVESIRERYRKELERLLATTFTPERLGRRLDELAAVVRPFIAEESSKRLEKFELAVGEGPSDGPRDGHPFDPNRPVFQLKRFFKARAESVQDQLAGKPVGVELTRTPPR